MTAPLRTLQRHALESLLDPACPRCAVVRAPVQSGIRQVIETVIRQVATSDTVLVLTPARVQAEQWQLRLTEGHDFPVTWLDSAATALDLLEHPPAQRGQVIVATYPRAVHGPSSRALSELAFGLIVYDDNAAIAEGRLRWLSDRAQRVIALSPLSSPQAPTWPVVVDITAEDLPTDGLPWVLEVPFSVNRTEAVLQRLADQLLRECAEAVGELVERTDDRSIASLHTLLLGIAAELEKPPETNDSRDSAQRDRLLRQTWDLVERVENLPTTDSRLRALEDVLAGELAAGSRCIIIAVKLSDVSYIANYLASAGRPPAAVVKVNSSTLADREGVLRSLGPGQYIVAGMGIAPHLETLATPYTVILWSSGTLGQWIIDRVGGAEGVRILQLAPDE